MARKTTQKTTKQTGGARLKAEGRSLVWATFDAEEKENIRRAAAVVGLPMSQFIQTIALREAEKILEKFKNSP